MTMIRKIATVLSLMYLSFIAVEIQETDAAALETDGEIAEFQHNWKVYHIDHSVIEAGSHDFTYWKNFMRKTRTCHVTHEMKTIVYYCDLHDHTKSETSLVKANHSTGHSH
ncbi:hypothetical protein [Oceanobacillus massiliensis]|uniref:hypothetical protein n=1 Tax=Oceanobacillus massiliensis TaxID=1465765 RepID=UPI000288E460|nr:hypothetical protein [Oceanobacillus massiliensis]